MLVDAIKYIAILSLVIFGITLFDSGLSIQIEPPQKITISRTLERYNLPTLEQIQERLPLDLNAFFVDFKDTAPQALKPGGAQKVGYVGVGGVALVIIGLMAFIIGWFTLIAASFMTHFLWGMAALALPGFGYVYAFSHMELDVTRKGVMVSAFGVILSLTGALLTVVAV